MLIPTGTDIIDSVPCGPETFSNAPLICCAQDGWPDSGECMCDRHVCSGNSYSCECGSDKNYPSSITCDAESVNGTTCCTDAPSIHPHTCFCSDSKTICSSGQTAVPSCALEYMECGPGAHKVDRCD